MTLLGFLSMKVETIMTKDIIMVNTDTCLNDVKDIFDKNNFHHLPVVENGRVEGIISKSDLLLMMDWGVRLGLKGSEVRNENLLRSNLAGDIMTSVVLTVSPDDTLQYCLDVFLENYFRAMPVLDSEKNICGIITSYDILRGMELFKFKSESIG